MTFIQRRSLAWILTFALGVLGAAARGAEVQERSRFGRSVEDRDLRAVNIGAPSHKTRVLLVGCIHGNECAGKAILKALRRMPGPEDFELWLVSSTNPDGAQAGTRQNARGVDLNRNFPVGWRAYGEPWDTYYPGPRPSSEPETRAAMRLVKELRPDITIWYHQHMALVVKVRRHIRVQRRYGELVGLPLERLDPLPGTAIKWQNRRFPGHLGMVVELPAGQMSSLDAKRHARAVATIARSWDRLR